MDTALPLPFSLNRFKLFHHVFKIHALTVPSPFLLYTASMTFAGRDFCVAIQ